MDPRLSITSIEEFDEITNNLLNSLNRINTLFGNEKKDVQVFFDNPKAWSGKAKEKAMEKYGLLSNSYPSITESLNNYVQFLVNTSNNYKKFEMETNRSLENNSSDLNVNS